MRMGYLTRWIRKQMIFHWCTLTTPLPHVLSERKKTQLTDIAVWYCWFSCKVMIWYVEKFCKSFESLNNVKISNVWWKLRWACYLGVGKNHLWDFNISIFWYVEIFFTGPKQLCRHSVGRVTDVEISGELI